MTEVNYRPAGLEDAELAADLMTASYPAMAQDPVITRRRWEQPKHGFSPRRAGLPAHGKRLVDEAKQARDSMAAVGIEPKTLAGWDHADRVRKLHELNEGTVQDVPHTVAIVREAFEDFEKRIGTPDRPHDRFWVALDGDRPVAMSYLKFPPVRGDVWTGYTCTDREYRGRGLARGIKLQSLAQAVELGVRFVYTGNDSENAPMLHINEELGYRSRPGFVSHLKRVEEKGDA